MQKKCPITKLDIFIAVPPIESCQNATKTGIYQVRINDRLIQVYCEVNCNSKWLVRETSIIATCYCV